MALDLTLPYPGVTTWTDLYEVLRANFVGINDLFTPSAWIDGGSMGNWTETYAVKYRKDAFGYVWLCGVVVATGTSANPIFTLGAGYWPSYPVRIPCIYDVADTDYSALLTIATNGQVSSATLTTGSIVFFDGINFRGA